MRSSLHGFLFFSSFTTFLAAHVFAHATNLASSDGMDGSSGAGQFSSKTTTTAGGTTYTLTGDVSIINIKSTLPANTSCFKDTAGALTFTGGNFALLFQNITSTAAGAAISTTADGKALTLSGFSSLSFLSCPSANTGVGAINSVGSTNIQQNTKVVFDSNHCTTHGGAITCKKTGATAAILTIQQNNSLVFSNNSAATSGGAIHADKLVLKAGGITLFENNHGGQKGGAISITGGGELDLTAESGNIIFKGNTITQNNRRVNNAINIGANGKIIQMRAKEGRSLIFYDPITVEGTSNEALTMNKVEGANAYNGKIVFSGRYIDGPNRYGKHVSKVTQPITLSSGALSLEEGAELQAKSLTQTAGSKVVLDQTSSIKTSENVTLNNLQLTVHDFVSPIPSKITTTGNNGTITLSGAISITGNEDFYNTPALAHPINQELLTLSAKDVSKLVVSNVPGTLHKEHQQHKGYQGEWTIDWAATPGSTSGGTTILGKKIATVHWRPVGYIPFGGSQEITTSLVPNSLWGNVVDLNSVSRAVESVATNTVTHDGFWVVGMKNFLHIDPNQLERGYRHNSSGYTIGINKQTLSDNVFSAALCQLFARDKDYVNSHLKQRSLSGSVYGHHLGTMPMWRFLCGNSHSCPSDTNVASQIPVIVSGQITYSHSKNDLIIYHNDNTLTEGAWSNYALSGEISNTFIYRLRKSAKVFQMISPFIKLRGVYAEEKKFTETGLRSCSFSNACLANLSLPIGIKFTGKCPKNILSYDISVLYSADVARLNPQNLTTFVIGGLTPWKTCSQSLNKQAVAVQGSGRYFLSDVLEVFAQGNFERRNSSYSYNSDCGAKIHF
ncbi:autotransporter beta-domain protein [Chlamydia ibidis]|uniref:Autotransporter beta-domain protein n=2 Tax=Chlamydia ibidis TaxID=1405396 RepID=S7KLX0_9CHLA|nr:polymorphic outer membrane protein middle domain-containing protein [Chlamydia ibidis]EPP35440.1 autotransporter beta-domain protein [Chlamydia ibidis]EQM63220.1 autotransporter beta-domain protein [Chlamydia ibidis 10-1398/6]